MSTPHPSDPIWTSYHLDKDGVLQRASERLTSNGRWIPISQAAITSLYPELYTEREIMPDIGG